MCLWFGVGQLVFRLHKRSFTGRILRFGAMFTNFSFVGFPVVQQLYGDTGLLYFVIFTMPIRMVYYSSAQPLLAPPGVNIGKKSFRESLRGWFSPPVVAVFIGLALYLSGWRFPVPVDKAVASIGATASPLGMNYACRLGEIDLIAESRDYIVFVEVKLRRDDSFAAAREFVTAAKQDRIRKTALLWLSQNPTEKQPRFDVIEIYAPEGEKSKQLRINHIENAFE